MTLIARISTCLLILLVLFSSELNVCTAEYTTAPSGPSHVGMTYGHALSINEIDAVADLISEIDEDMLHDIDTDNDGRVSFIEWMKTGGSEILFQLINQNNDSYLTADDLNNDSPFPFSTDADVQMIPNGCWPVNLSGEWILVCWC